MSEFAAFVQLGVRHILDVAAADHILFLLALAVIYRPRDWRDALWVVTSFTIGHSITLALAVTHTVTMPSAVIEFLIPVTIVATCIENIAVRDRARVLWRGHYRPVFAGIFGVVHGAGFANYLQSLFVERLVVPLFGFNVGIEIGQLVVLTLAAAAMWTIDRAISAARTTLDGPSALRIRVLTVSAAVGLVAARWAFERRPW